MVSEHVHTGKADPNGAPGTTGRVLHAGARYYDLLVWIVTLGRETAFRDKILDLARVTSGESVLDVGCGTGTLALAAKRRAGASGEVHGIDASGEMIGIARKKASKAAADVSFEIAVVEALPFADARFDVVLSTLMLHHLPRPARGQFAAEIRRVLKPGGRVVVVDFAPRPHRRKGLLDHFHRHGYVALDDAVSVLADAGLNVAESGALGMRNMHFTIASAP